MISEREMICVVCPNGCRMTVRLDAGRVVSIVGAVCKRGDAYAAEECVAPKRMVTTLVRTEGRAPLSVKTAAPIPKDKIFDVLAAVHAVRVSSPTRIGDVVLANVCGTGVDILATSVV